MSARLLNLSKSGKRKANFTVKRSALVGCCFTAVVVWTISGITGCLVNPHVGAGPVIGATLRGRVVLGWEAGGGTDQLLRGNIGGSYRLPVSNRRVAKSRLLDLKKKQKPDLTTEYVHYLVYEPGVFGGGTLGIAHSDFYGFGGSVGLWAGFPFPVQSGNTEDYSHNPFKTEKEGNWDPVITISIGWRYLAGEHEICFIPKFLYAFIPRMSS